MQVNKDDYIQWRTHPVTEAFVLDMLQAADGLISQLAEYAGDNSLEDKRKTGIIAGLTALVDWQPVFTKEENDDDGIDGEGSSDSD